MVRLFRVPVCIPSSASPSSALGVWLSEEEFEEVEDMRDLASRPSRTWRKSPWLMTSSFLLCPWTVGQMEHTVSGQPWPSHRPRLPTWQWRRQPPFLSTGTEEDVQGLLVGDVDQLHLVQQVHVHLHGRDAADRSCRRRKQMLRFICEPRKLLPPNSRLL